MSKKYLLEIGTEELPYKFLTSALNQLKESFAKMLDDSKITYENITVYGTPRRLCVIIDGLEQAQPDSILEIKGPPATIAFDSNGNLTNAGLGFAKKQGLSTEILTKKEINGIEYLYASVEQSGKPTSAILQDAVPNIILNLQGSHFMRWADLDIKFSRPLKWIVSVMGNQEVKISIGNIQSSTYSEGHRFATNRRVLIESPDNYLEKLYDAKVIADPHKRKQEIVRLIKNAAESVCGTAQMPDELLEEVNNLVEWPTPVVGTFDKKYLEVTNDVITCVLAHHQRYFPIFDADGKLMNYFITIANHDEHNLDNIKKGNEKVVKPRLDDAIFFYKEDTKNSLESKIEQLKGVTFQRGLGSVYDKTLRIQQIAEFICNMLNINAETTSKVKRAAYLCKADLVTNMVREFTELQGIIGGDYAAKDSEDNVVASGIREHYLPTSSEGQLADSVSGQIVGIADKIDTICAVFALGKAPTGSADPLGLRRAAIGIINTVINKNISLNLSELIQKSVNLLPIETENQEKLAADIKEFIVQRLKNLLSDSYRHDVIEAAVCAKDPLLNLSDLIERLKLISELVKHENYKSFHESANRILRITKDQSISEEIKSELLTDDAEKELCECVAKFSYDSDYKKLTEELLNSIPKIDKFFDKVLVMDNNESVKNNRLALLAKLRVKFVQIADFSKIVF